MGKRNLILDRDLRSGLRSWKTGYKTFREKLKRVLRGRIPIKKSFLLLITSQCFRKLVTACDHVNRIVMRAHRTVNN